MCLSKVTKIVTNPSNVIQDGWKESSWKSFAYPLHDGTYGMIYDKWLEAEKITIKASDGQSYATGFHIYTDDKIKPESATKRVYFRQVTCVGRQSDYECAIAHEIYIPKQDSDWPPNTPSTPPSSTPSSSTKKSLTDKLKQAIRKTPGDA